MRKAFIIVLMTAVFFSEGYTGSAWAQKLKIALIDDLSGSMASLGQASLRELKFAVNKYMGDQVDVISLDGKLKPKESVKQLKKAISEGVRFIVQGNSSAVAHALLDAITKHNSLNPDKPVIYLNHSAVDPALTERKCSFWHFRFDAHIGMKLQAMMVAIAKREDFKKIYIIGQDYAFGKSFAANALEFLSAMRPDIQIVGNELHPLGGVKNFLPYTNKIKQAKPDAIITGNWGGDMVGLVKALEKSGVKSLLYTFYGAGAGISAAIGEAGNNRVFIVSATHNNPKVTDEWEKYRQDFVEAHPNNDLLYPRIVTLVRSLDAAIRKAGSKDDLLAIGRALSNTQIMRLDGVKVIIRSEDHQILMPLHVSVHTKKGIKWDYDGSGFGTIVKTTISRKGTTRPVKCKITPPEK